ncbi:TolC family protein [Sulfurovum sp. ST-21]|uniref:TolC family protein n=1 Tax=Sulfurovum indicum TaxID=2779528 RepID=A0A7M1S3C4_9BACT|nr:TolC family protein [Sulfurovum indicum]QOR61933.1 TolC family protein [Sulfurovum indicum]
MRFFLGFLLLFGVQGIFAQSLTLKEAIAKTFANHPDIKTFMLRIQQAEQGYNAAYADYLPQIDLSAAYAPVQTFSLPVNGTFHTVDDRSWNVGVSLRQKVWDFKKTSSLVAASKIDEDISKLSLKEVKSLLAYKVKTLYALLVVQKEAVAVRRKDLETKKIFYEQSKALVRQGLKNHADASRFLSSVYIAEDALAGAKAAYEKAKTSLSLYMGVPLPKRLSLQSGVVKKGAGIGKSVEREVVANNYKLRMNDRTVEKNRMLQRASEAAHFGSIDLVVSHSRVDTLNAYNTEYIGVSYNLPLYHGGRLNAQEQQAKIGYQIAQEQRASEALALKEELRSLIIDIRRFEKTIKAKKAQLLSARETQKVIKARYKEGLATYIEVLDSTSVVLNAELGVLEAYYSQSLALDRIEYLKGKI